jgi:precorrin-6y C5,15-methyltransferase (decarboxylating) CbiE subunit
MKKLVILGCGPGHRDYLTIIAEKRIREARVLVGPPKLLDLFPEFSGDKMVLKQNYQEIADLLPSVYKEKDTVVLVTGDPGIHSYARMIISSVGAENCEIIPGISSIQLAFARLAIPWEEAIIISLHGKTLNSKVLIDRITRYPKVVLLTDENNSTAYISQILEEHQINPRPAFVCQDLSLPSEYIWKTNTREMAQIKTSPLSLIIILNQKNSAHS